MPPTARLQLRLIAAVRGVEQPSPTPPRQGDRMSHRTMTIRAITAAMVAALAAACVSVPAEHATETIAFQANTGHLWYWSSDSRDGYQHGTGHDLHLGMMKASAQASLT